MKTEIGGNRLGAGGKMEVNMRNYNRSTHDLSATWRSTMSSGTLVPFASELALPGDIWDVDLACEVLTLPTIGPLFGSYKVQLDVFQVPIRLYNGGLHMNRLGIGMDMSAVKLPQVEVNTIQYKDVWNDNSQINASCIFKYLGIGGIGGLASGMNGESFEMSRSFNAVPYLAYWDIYKNYYANKQEERGMVISSSATGNTTTNARITRSNGSDVTCYNTTVDISNETEFQNVGMRITFENENQPNASLVQVKNASGGTTALNNLFANIVWDTSAKTLTATNKTTLPGFTEIGVDTQTIDIPTTSGIKIQEFPLKNIDNMRDAILQHPFESGTFNITQGSEAPYSLPMKEVAGDQTRKASYFTQEGLGLKTYQSDLLNNWISTEWIDGTNGINEVTAVSTAGDKFTIDALNIANKVYNMLNRIAISGGTYDDWLEAVYTGDRAKSVESPVYQGSLIKELSFQEVVSTAGNVNVGEGNQLSNGAPTGTLSGRGKLTGKNKGGKMTIKVDEPSYIMMISSITPRLDYSQSTKWDMDLKTLDDLHKPALDAIGYQDLITQNMAWSDTVWDNATKVATYRSAGKQPAWINYMTEINRCYGGFAEPFVEGGSGSMFMTLNRKYELDEKTGAILDLTTYVDPSKFSHIFAETQLDAQNFWVQISKQMKVRRKMSAKIIPNL